MNNKQKTLPWIQAAVSITSLLVFAVLVWGCGSSGETPRQNPSQPNASEIMRREVLRARQENDSLKAQLARQQQDNRTVTARAAQLETENAELRDKLKAVPPPTPTPVYVAPSYNPPPTPRITDPNQAYQEGLNLFHSRKYGEAENALQSILDAGGSTLEDHCHYWIGECEYAQKNYQGAIEHFQKVFSFNRSSKKDDAQMMLANSYYAMGNKTRAKEEYQKLIEKFPASPYAKSAKAKLSKIKG